MTWCECEEMAWPINSTIPTLGWQPGLTASYRSLRDRCEWRQRVSLQQVQLIPAPGAAQSSERALHINECTIDASGDAGARVRRGEQFTVLCLNAAGGDAPGAGPRQHCTWDVDVAFE